MTRLRHRTAFLGALLAVAIGAAPAHALTTKPYASRITDGPHAGRIAVTFPVAHEPGDRTERVRIVVRDHRGKRIASTVKTYPVHPSERITAPHHILLTRAQSRRARGARHLKVSVRVGDHTTGRARVSRLQDTPFTPPAPIYQASYDDRPVSADWDKVSFYVGDTGGTYVVTQIIAFTTKNVRVTGAPGAPLTPGADGWSWSGPVTLAAVPSDGVSGQVTTVGQIAKDASYGVGGWQESTPDAPPFWGGLKPIGRRG